MTEPSGERIELYGAGDGWRWRYVAQNGEIEHASSEGYENRGHALRQAAEEAEKRGCPLYTFAEGGWSQADPATIDPD